MKTNPQFQKRMLGILIILVFLYSCKKDFNSPEGKEIRNLNSSSSIDSVSIDTATSPPGIVLLNMVDANNNPVGGMVWLTDDNGNYANHGGDYSEIVSNHTIRIWEPGKALKLIVCDAADHVSLPILFTAPQLSDTLNLGTIVVNETDLSNSFTINGGKYNNSQVIINSLQLGENYIYNDPNDALAFFVTDYYYYNLTKKSLSVILYGGQGLGTHSLYSYDYFKITLGDGTWLRPYTASLTITEYGQIGGKIKGTFSGTFEDDNNSGEKYEIKDGQFSITRKY